MNYQSIHQQRSFVACSSVLTVLTVTTLTVAVDLNLNLVLNIEILSVVFGGETVVLLGCNVLFYRGTALASTNLHGAAMHRILRSPSSFFDTTPIGRIISRFSQDIYVIDSNLPICLAEWIECLLEVM